MSLCEQIKKEFQQQLLELIEATNNDDLERGIRFCRKDDKLFLGTVNVGSATETSFGGCPEESENGHVGIGTFHTHPPPGTNGPSPADVQTAARNATSRKYGPLGFDRKPQAKSEVDCIGDSKGDMLCFSGATEGFAALYDILWALGGDSEMSDCMKELRKKHPESSFNLESGIDIGIIAEIEKSCTDPFFDRLAAAHGVTQCKVNLHPKVEKK